MDEELNEFQKKTLDLLEKNIKLTLPFLQSKLKIDSRLAEDLYSWVFWYRHKKFAEYKRAHIDDEF